MTELSRLRGSEGYAVRDDAEGGIPAYHAGYLGGTQSPLESFITR